jgi:hypothetical protein
MKTVLSVQVHTQNISWAGVNPEAIIHVMFDFKNNVKKLSQVEL